MGEQETAPRGRHAPPLEVRQDRQRARLFAAASAVFARNGFADATAEAIAREAGMSKATFYEHFGNKEECILALFDAAIDVVIEGDRRRPRATTADESPQGRVGASVRAFLDVVDAFPDQAQTLLVEIIGAGPRAAERRDAALARVADYIDEANQADAEAGVVDRLASPHDAFAIVGAIVELASRQLRTKEPDGHPRARARDRAAGPRPRRGGSAPRERGVSTALDDARGRRHRLPRLPAARRVARARRAREARRVPRLGLLGPPDPRLRRPGGARADPRPRARRARRQPHRAACSPATAPATSCSRRCTAPASPTSRPPSTATTGWR